MSARRPRRRRKSPQAQTVAVPLTVLLALEDELNDAADLLRLAAELGLAVRGMDASAERLGRVAEQIGVPAGRPDHADDPALLHLDDAALTDLATAPETILAVVQRRLYRMRAVVGIVRDRA